VGTVVAGSLALSGVNEVAGIQAGLFALGLNLALSVGLSFRKGES
jgi:hypothetical protein